MAAPKKSLRPKARPSKEKMKDMMEAAEQRKRNVEALKQSVKYRAKGGEMKKPVAMSYGGKMPKKMGMGGGMGKCRGMGAATRGGNFKMG